MESSLDKSVNFKQYGRMLWRRRGIILLCSVLCISSTLVALEFVPRTYESQVTLMIEDSQLLTSELEKIRGGMLEPPKGYGANEERMSKLASRIRSRPFLERVIRILKMHEDPLIRSKAEQELRRRRSDVGVEEMAIRILVENLQARIRFGSSGAGIYKVTVADYSGENAYLLAKWISEIFVDASNQRNIDLIRSAHEFGAEQERIYEQKLQRSEEALERYKESRIQREFTQSSVRPENLSYAEALSRRIADEAALTRVRCKDFGDALDALQLREDSEIILSGPRIRQLSAALESALTNEVRNRLASPASDLGTWPPSGTYENLRRSLLQEAEDEAVARYGDRGAEIVEAAASYLLTRIDLDAQTSAEAVVRASIGASKMNVESSPGGEIELARLEEEVETNRRLLQSFQSQMVASDVSRAVEITKLGMQIEILDPANRPLVPSSPNRKKILLASLLLGPLIGMGMAFLSEVADPTLRTLEDFARVMPEPILGTTPLVTRLTTRRKWIRRHWVPASVAAVVMLAIALYAVRDQILLHVWTSGNPVKVVNPESGTDANHR